MRLLIATHGKLASGFKSALEIIVGNVTKVDFIDAYVCESDFKKELDEYFDKRKDEKFLVCTDLFGGSVNQALIEKIKEKDFYLIAGINFPLLLEILIEINTDNFDEKNIEKYIDEAKAQMINVKKFLNFNIKDDFD